MPPPFLLTRPFVPPLGWIAARYIAQNRLRLLPSARPLDPAHRACLSGFFNHDLLDRVRVMQGPIPRPPLHSLALILGLEDLPDMSTAGAITFVELVVYPDDLSVATLFHELVHVAQYDALGLMHFARLYVRGYLESGSYEGIPLERQAYNLEARFTREPDATFSVEAEVDHWREHRRY
jgi:hypothetical protein